jgi:hypothetical protein
MPVVQGFLRIRRDRKTRRITKISCAGTVVALEWMFRIRGGSRKAGITVIQTGNSFVTVLHTADLINAAAASVQNWAIRR